MHSAPAKSSTGLLRQFLQDARSVGRLARGLARFYRTGTTPDDAYHSLIWLHCRTNGRSNDFLHALARRRFPPADLPPAHGVLGRLSPGDAAEMASQIRSRGYRQSTARLSVDVCDRLRKFALSTAARLHPPRAGLPETAVYDPASPLAEAYRFDEAALIAQPDVQTLMADPSLLAVAQSYLGCVPVLSIVAMWWSTSAHFADDARAELAQMYHFDMDRVKWIKFFFYLTDVTSDRGPHCYIAKSHRAGGQRPELLRRGYVRIRDEELEPYYPPGDRMEIVGPRGTIFAADTRGYHKGLAPRSGDRLMLQLEFCDTLFGAPYGRPAFPLDCVPELADRRRAFPRIYSRYR